MSDNNGIGAPICHCWIEHEGAAFDFANVAGSPSRQRSIGRS